MGRAVLTALAALTVVAAAWLLDDRGDDITAPVPSPVAVPEDVMPTTTGAETPATTTTATAPPTTVAPVEHAATDTVTAVEVPEIEIQAAAWAVTDLDGRVLAGEAADERRPIASLAKLPLALAALDALVAETAHTVPASAATVRGRKVGWAPTTTVPTVELIDGLLRTSGNDAALTAAAALGGDDVALAAISALGGDGIVDVAGLSRHTVASSAEVARWLAAVVAEPELRRPLEARANEPLPGQGGAALLGERVPELVAVKTSWSPAAGRSLAALMRFGDEERLVVVLDATNPAQAAVDAYVLTWFTERARSPGFAADAG